MGELTIEQAKKELVSLRYKDRFTKEDDARERFLLNVINPRKKEPTTTITKQGGFFTVSSDGKMTEFANIPEMIKSILEKR